MSLFQTCLAMTTVTPITTAATYKITVLKISNSTRGLQSRVGNGNYFKIEFLSKYIFVKIPFILINASHRITQSHKYTF